MSSDRPPALLPTTLWVALRLKPILAALRLLKTSHRMLPQEPRCRLERAEEEIRAAIDELYAAVDASRDELGRR